MSVNNKMIIASIIAASAASLAQAQHADILVQRQGNKLVTGSAELDTATFTIGQRVFEGEFDAFFAGSDPGFNAVSGGSVPAGYQALPGSAPLTLDIVPVTIGSASRNLFYWDGQGEVEFAVAPAGTSLHLQRLNPAQELAADGSNTSVLGYVVQTTSASGNVHFHPNYLLDGPGADDPASGIYLLPLRLSMSGLENSDTAFLAFHAGTASEAAHEAAVDWVGENLAVVPEPAGISLAVISGLGALRRRR